MAQWLSEWQQNTLSHSQRDCLPGKKNKHGSRLLLEIKKKSTWNWLPVWVHVKSFYISFFSKEPSLIQHVIEHPSTSPWQTPCWSLLENANDSGIKTFSLQKPAGERVIKECWSILAFFSLLIFSGENKHINLLKCSESARFEACVYF
jgi:hypothetical protein